MKLAGKIPQVLEIVRPLATEPCFDKITTFRDWNTRDDEPFKSAFYHVASEVCSINVQRVVQQQVRCFEPLTGSAKP